MKPVYCLLLMVAPLAMPGYAQDPLSPFLFEDYNDAVVHFHGGQTSTEKVNYNLVESALYFIDQRDGQVKVVANYRGIDSLVIAGRTFLLDGENALEKVSDDPTIYIRFNASSTQKPPPVAYGGTSKLASVDVYSTAFFQGLGSDRKTPEQEVSEIYHDYVIELGGKRKKFSNFKQFHRIYRDHKKALEKYVTEHELDFNDVKGIIALCRYAASL
ncbi:hypothetical protein [Parapedobacter sp. 10938]|uniref:hypothetical protein n=1 Tax=Parapedobacter flavus TaxID=3110225 RepID=UPI002DBD1C70|nr:hypothetical protein [Parapedobacter sp. 10938]MEC3880669.1 hypothetical protein [Parapedobacter sp. 10938]